MESDQSDHNFSQYQITCTREFRPLVNEKTNDSKTKHQYQYTLHIPEFRQFLENKTYREIRIEKSESKNVRAHEECKFQVRVKLQYQYTSLEIYYKCSGLSCDYTYLAPSLGIFKGLPHGFATVSNQPYQWIRNNKWTFLAEHPVSKLHIQDNKSVDLQFQFEVCLSQNRGLFQTCLPDNNENEEFIASNNLVSDLTNLLPEMSLTDVTVKSLDGHELPAHKIFLIARSEVFKAHFEHRTVESITNIVESPFNSDVVKNVLSYIYTDNAPQIDEISQKLLMAADFYQLNGLKKLCEFALEKNLTIENAIETLELAFLYKAVYLKTKTLGFIKNGLASEIIKTKAWNKLESAEVIKSLYECVVNQHAVYKVK